jgi:hypothetical protein
MDQKSKSRLTQVVQGATAEDLQSLTCPDCGGGINVEFVPSGRKGKAAGSLYIMCTQCMWRVITDGIPIEPPWVRELGPKVQTAKKLAISLPKK